ncbi:hypothetical protein L218DRAFT_1077311 [Marasmius fiardii PR-910]|nr:hypothetical protein L218DRAFT_1077311 [Marasmius fiardii PR-910]
MSCCSTSAASPPSPTAVTRSSSSSKSPSPHLSTLSSLPSPTPVAEPEDPNKSRDFHRESVTPLTLTDFTTLVSAALAFDTPIFEPLSLPCRPESRCFSGSFQDNVRSMKPDDKLTMLKRIKSVLLRESQSASNFSAKRSSSSASDLPKLPLPPPTDPLFTPHVPLPLALERGLVSYGDEPASPSSSTVSGSCESCDSTCSLVFPPYVDAKTSISSTSSEGCSASSYSDSLSRASSSVDLTSDPSDPFAKGHVQVVRRSIGSSSSGSLYGVVGQGAYSLNNHPYATVQRRKSPSKKSRKKFITRAPLPPPSGPLPPPPIASIILPHSCPPSRIFAELPPLPPRLPMPTRPLPPTPDEGSRDQLSPRYLTQDWTLRLPLEETAFDSFRVSVIGGGMASVRRRKVNAKIRRARRTSLPNAAITSRLPVKKNESLGGELRPGHRRQGSPFPLLFEAPPTPIASPLSTPTTPTFSRAVCGSPQKSRKSRPPPLAHTLVLSPTGLPVPPSPSSEPDVPVTPISLTPEYVLTEGEACHPTTPPSGGRTHIPGWFLDDSDMSEYGHGKSSEEGGKAGAEERYWTASESVSTHEY